MKPTHRLIIEIPLDLSGANDDFDYDRIHMALNTVMHVTRLAVDHVLAGLVDVRIEADP